MIIYDYQLHRGAGNASEFAKREVVVIFFSCDSWIIPSEVSVATLEILSRKVIDLRIVSRTQLNDIN